MCHTARRARRESVTAPAPPAAAARRSAGRRRRRRRRAPRSPRPDITRCAIMMFPLYIYSFDNLRIGAIVCTHHPSAAGCWHQTRCQVSPDGSSRSVGLQTWRVLRPLPALPGLSRLSLPLFPSPREMHLMYYIGADGKRVYTLQKAAPDGSPTHSAHPGASRRAPSVRPTRRLPCVHARAHARPPPPSSPRSAVFARR